MKKWNIFAKCAAAAAAVGGVLFTIAKKKEMSQDVILPESDQIDGVEEVSAEEVTSVIEENVAAETEETEAPLETSDTTEANPADEAPAEESSTTEKPFAE